jgi:hypothetical protein
MAKKLQEILNIEPSIKEKGVLIIKEGENTFKNKSEHFSGFYKTFLPSEEGGVNFPPESKHVVETVENKLDYIFKSVNQMIDVELMKEFTNTTTKADLILPNGKVLLKDAPAPAFLFLEKAIVSLRNMVKLTPTLPPDEIWKEHPNKDRIWKTDEIKTAKTQKEQVPIVMYPATEFHPAQTQMISKDVRVGEWSSIKESGAIPVEIKAKWLNNLDILENAIKKAKARANDCEIVDVKVAKAIQEFIFGSEDSVSA